jgi:hypothetical protein
MNAKKTIMMCRRSFSLSKDITIFEVPDVSQYYQHIYAKYRTCGPIGIKVMDGILDVNVLSLMATQDLWLDRVNLRTFPQSLYSYFTYSLVDYDSPHEYVSDY